METGHQIKIGGIEAKRGEKVFGNIDISDNLGPFCQLPLGIIYGHQEGPTLLVTAGAYACEYAGIAAVSRFYQGADPMSLSGTVIVIPCLNVPGFRMQMPALFPLDNRNLNRSFPGMAEGSPAEILAHTFMKNILPLADFGIDCHGGDIGQKLYPLIICHQTDDASLSSKSMELAKAGGFDYTYYCDIRDSDDTEWGWPSKANKSGIPSILTEAGYDGCNGDHEIKLHLMAIKNIMIFLGMIKGEIVRESKKNKTTVIHSLFTINANRMGIFTPFVEPRDTIRKGQIVGVVKDLKGDTVQKVAAQEDGLLIETMINRIVKKNDILFSIARLEN